MKKIYSSKLQGTFEFLMFSIFGVCLIYFGVVHPVYKIHTLSAVCIFSFVPVYLRYKKNRWPLHSLGVRTDNITKASLLWYALGLTVGLVGLYLYSTINDTNQGASEYTIIWYSILGSILQEFLFRIHLWKLGEELFGRGFINYTVNVLVFTGMHIVYDGFWNRGLWLMMLLAGVLFTGLYKKYPNIYLITIVHIILNVVAVYLGVYH